MLSPDILILPRSTKQTAADLQQFPGLSHSLLPEAEEERPNGDGRLRTSGIQTSSSLPVIQPSQAWLPVQATSSTSTTNQVNKTALTFVRVITPRETHSASAECTIALRSKEYNNLKNDNYNYNVILSRYRWRKMTRSELTSNKTCISFWLTVLSLWETLDLGLIKLYSFQKVDFPAAIHGIVASQAWLHQL